MGILKDLGILVGILPMPLPDFHEKSLDKTSEKINCEKLEELNGNFVWAQDFHHGIRYGKLKYTSFNAERYYLVNSNQEFSFNVHDLENIGPRTVLD